MIDLKLKSDCSGCHACFSICPKDSITMSSDDEGFLYPVINKDTCIDCGLCEKVCQSKNPIKALNEPTAYAAYNTDETIRIQSSSGGIFTLVAEYIIDNGGVVFGAAFDDNLNVHHTKISAKDNLNLLRGSKYVQSTIGNTYKEAKEILKTGQLVLYTGTPCQIDGLLNYLGKDYDNLFTQDLICHGAPSPMVWQKYLTFHSEKNGKIAREPSPCFRCKSKGWKRYSVLFTYANNAEYQRTVDKDIYMQAFLHDLSLRPSCYDCKSKGTKRNSDITLADFWGIWNVLPEMFDDKGTSLILVNSQKGKVLLDKIRDRMTIREVDADEALKYNSPAYKSVLKPLNRDAFMETIKNDNDFEKTVKKYTRPNIVVRTIKFVKKIVKGMLIRCLKTKHY